MRYVLFIALLVFAAAGAAAQTTLTNEDVLEHSPGYEAFVGRIDRGQESGSGTALTNEDVATTSTANSLGNSDVSSHAESGENNITVMRIPRVYHPRPSNDVSPGARGNRSEYVTPEPEYEDYYDDEPRRRIDRGARRDPQKEAMEWLESNLERLGWNVNTASVARSVGVEELRGEVSIRKRVRPGSYSMVVSIRPAGQYSIPVTVRIGRGVRAREVRRSIQANTGVIRFHVREGERDAEITLGRDSDSRGVFMAYAFFEGVGIKLVNAPYNSNK